LMDDIVGEIQVSLGNYPGVEMHPHVRSYLHPASLISLAVVLAEYKKEPGRRSLACPCTREPLNCEKVLISAGILLPTIDEGDGDVLRRTLTGEHVTKEELTLFGQFLEGKLLVQVNNISKNDFPSVFTLVPAPTQGPPANFMSRMALLKERAQGLVFDSYEVHCLCEFRMRDECNVMQPCWHPTALAGIRVKKPNEFVKKVGPILKATAVVLQVVEVGLKLAGIPVFKIISVVKMMSGYFGKAQKLLSHVRGVYDGFEGESDEKVLKKIKQSSARTPKPKPLDGEALIAMKGLFGNTAVSSFFFFSFLIDY